MNCFAQTISSTENAYAFLPFILLGPLFKFVSQQPCPLTIFARDLQPCQYWWPILQHRASSCFKVGPKGQKDILSFPDASLNGTLSPRPLQWVFWAFHLSLNCLLNFFVLYSRWLWYLVFGVHPFSVQSASTQQPRLLLLSTLSFNSSSPTPPISIFISSDRPNKYRLPPGLHPLLAQVISPEATRFSWFPTLSEEPSICYTH